MNTIHNTDNTFDFNKLHLAKPHQIPGGSFFIRLSINNAPLYIQPPKCTLKNGIMKAGKKYYSDFMFTNENSDFIEWMENLENYCQRMLYENRNDWFEGDMEMHDIENYFTSPLKIYKSGKFYLARVNISTNLGKPTLKIYNEDEEIVTIEDVKENMNIMSVLEINGIKCSPTCFQIELDIKQMMTLAQNNIFDKCIFNSENRQGIASENIVSEDLGKMKEHVTHESNADVLIEDVENNTDDSDNYSNSEEVQHNHHPLLLIEDTLEKNVNDNIQIDTNENDCNINNSSDQELMQENIKHETPQIYDQAIDEVPIHKEPDLEKLEIQEVNLTLDEIPTDNYVSIKNKNHVYYEMYKEAKRKSKVARTLALSSYLEAKRIKNLYMLEDTSDSEDSDYENMNNE